MNKRNDSKKKKEIISSAHLKDTILAVEDKKGSFLLIRNNYLVAPVLGESIEDAVRLTLVAIQIDNRSDDNILVPLISCRLETSFRGIVIWSMELPLETIGIMVRSEGKGNAQRRNRSLVAVNIRFETVRVIAPNGIHFRLNPSGEAMMIERVPNLKFTFRASWSTFELDAGTLGSLGNGVPRVSSNITSPQTVIEILAWQHFLREYNAGRCITIESVRILVETEINRLVELRGRNEGSNRHFIKKQAAWYVFNKLRHYDHVSAPYLTDGNPPADGGLFMDISALEQNDLYYTQERFPFRKNLPHDFKPDAVGCPRAPPRISGTTASFSRNCAGKECRVPCLAPNPMTCLDPDPNGGLGQGMPLGFEDGGIARVRCRMLLKGDAEPAQVLAAVNCNSTDPTHACMGKMGSGDQKPRVSNTTELDRYMSSYCTKIADFQPGDVKNDCPVDPVTGARPNRCPNALRLGQNGKPGPANACRRWQHGSGADAAHSAYVALCNIPENQAQPWCDCIAGSLPGGRFFKMHDAASNVPFTTRQNEGCWFPPCAKNDYTLQRRSDVETDLAACQVSCVNVTNLSDSSNITMAEVSQQMTCSVGRETINVRPGDASVTPEPKLPPPPSSNINPPSNNEPHVLLPTPPPGVPDAIMPDIETVNPPRQPTINPPAQPPGVQPQGPTEGNDHRIFGMERTRFFVASGVTGVAVIVVCVLAYKYISSRRKKI